MITEKNFKEKVVNDVNKLEGYKISYIYWAFPTLNTKNMEKWFNNITQKFSETLGTIQIIKPIDENYTSYKNLEYWKLPDKYSNLQEKYNKKITEFLKYFGGEFESHRNWYTNNVRNKNYMKFIFSPIIEIHKEDKMCLFFINVYVYSNGVIGIELIEDLSTIEFENNLHTIKPKILNDKIFPHWFISKKRKYKLAQYMQNQQQVDLIKKIKYQTINLSPRKEVSNEHLFEVFYITNLDKINSKELYKNLKIENILINSPIIKWDENTKQEDLVVPAYENDYIRTLNKASKHIVVPSKQLSTNSMQVASKLASYFFSVADYYFQKVFINELQLMGIDDLNISNKRDILDFKSWLLKYKRILMSIYRPNMLASFALYTHLEKNSYFLLPNNLEEITQEEINIIQLEENYKNELQNKRNEKLNKKIELRTRRMNFTLFVLGILAIFEVLNVFTDNKKYIFIFGLTISTLIIYYTFIFKKKNSIPLLLKVLIVFLIATIIIL